MFSLRFIYLTLHHCAVTWRKSWLVCFKHLDSLLLNLAIDCTHQSAELMMYPMKKMVMRIRYVGHNYFFRFYFNWIWLQWIQHYLQWTRRTIIYISFSVIIIAWTNSILCTPSNSNSFLRGSSVILSQLSYNLTLLVFTSFPWYTSAKLLLCTISKEHRPLGGFQT